MNRAEMRLIAKQAEALKTVRAFLEPHPSWETNKLRVAAMDAIRATVGASNSSLYEWYEDMRKELNK